ncbi:MAG: HD domain-containing protein [Nitrosomonadales bacterium]|nr:HD domain-containing protein [Nitrosomonadales bacterium]
MEHKPTPDEIDGLFDNEEPAIVWGKARDLVRRMSPDYDFTLIQSVYEDVLRLFGGEYPGYAPIGTPYHDLPHTLGALLCAVRIMHGMHVSGKKLTDGEIALVIIAILMHDVGYSQRRGEESGTGAQYTQTHVQRGIEFVRQYSIDHKLPSDVASLAVMILGTEHFRPFDQIEFVNERMRMLGRIVVTADLTGQMADRIYLEKLLFLYLEFREAKLGNYRNMHDLLCQTNHFYEMARRKLDGPLGGIYKELVFHFRDTMGVDNNYYVESIEKNMACVSRIAARGEGEFFNMLKRRGIAEKVKSLI